MHLIRNFLCVGMLFCASLTSAALPETITESEVVEAEKNTEDPKVSDELVQKYAELLKKADQEVWTTEELVKECAKLAEQKKVVFDSTSIIERINALSQGLGLAIIGIAVIVIAIHVRIDQLDNRGDVDGNIRRVLRRLDRMEVAAARRFDAFEDRLDRAD